MEKLLSFEPGEDKVLGVFGDYVHVESHGFSDEVSFECVLKIPRTEYLRIWGIWLDGKKAYCEQYNHYCGVMGYTVATDYHMDGKVLLNKYNEKTEELETVEVDSFVVSKFDDFCDFEHG